MQFVHPQDERLQLPENDDYLSRLVNHIRFGDIAKLSMDRDLALTLCEMEKNVWKLMK